MKSKKAFIYKGSNFLTAILFLALILLFAGHAPAIVNLEVIIEMVDRGLASQTSSTAWERSAVYLDTNDYDGDTVTYYFEIVAKNVDTVDRWVKLKCPTDGTLMATITVPASTDVTRYRTLFTPPAGSKRYRITLEQTTSGGNLRVFTGRIIVVQYNATKTRIQIPLINDEYYGRNTGTGNPVDITDSTSYAQGDPDRFSLWKLDLSAWGDIPAPPATPWTFEAVIRPTDAGETASAALFKAGTTNMVEGTEVSLTGGTGFGYVSVDFATNATNFDDLAEFEVKHKITDDVLGTHDSRLGRASLYVRLTNLNKGEVYWRISKRIDTQSASLTHDYQRVLLNTNNYTSATVYHEAIGRESTVDDVVTVGIYDHGTADTGTTGGSIISGSSIAFDSTTKVIKRTSAITLTGGNRYIYDVNWTSGTLETASSFLVVKFADYVGGSLDVCQSGCPYNKIEDAVAAAIPGDTVTVTDSATYNPNPLQMKSGVDVVSTWNHETDPPDARPLITRGSNSLNVTFDSGVSNCKLKGFRIQAVGTAYSMLGTVYFYGNNTGITIEDCEVYDESVGCGILMFGRVSATIRRCTVHDTDGPGVTGRRMYDYWEGGTIVIEDTEVYNCGSFMNNAGIFFIDANTGDGYPGQVTVTNNCRVHNNATAGIVLGDLSQATVDGGNVIYDNGRTGIYLTGITQATVENNTIDNNGMAGTAGTDGSAYGGIHIVNVDTVTVSNNEIKNHINAAGICIEGNSDVTIGADLVASDPSAYTNDIHTNYAGIYFRSANSKPVIIRGNNIYSNALGGIRVNAALTGQVTITQNSINDNTRGGISINNTFTATITKNDIYSNTNRGGIHTDGGSPTLTIRQNKIHDNQGANRGGGIDVRHASGTIENNLVYKNGRGGIRIGNDITDVINNTVVWNGFNNTLGGGIIYDDPATGAINDPPDKTYTDPTLPFIRNNICAYNRKAGIGVVFDNSGYERDYNLLYDNWYGETVLGYNYGDCSWTRWPGCKKRQLGGAWPVAPNEIFGDPLFKNMAIDDYRLQRISEGDSSDSPAINAGDDGNDMGAYGGTDPIDW